MFDSTTTELLMLFLNVSRLQDVQNNLGQLHDSLVERIAMLNQEQSIAVAAFTEVLVAKDIFGFRHHDTQQDSDDTTVLPLPYFIQGAAGIRKFRCLQNYIRHASLD